MKTSFQNLKYQGDTLARVKGPGRLNLSYSALSTTISEF